VLGALSHDSPGFVTKIYGASGVSGGSVGLAEFASLPDEQKGRETLSLDYLAVPLTRLLTRDPLDSVACFGWGWTMFCSGTDRQRRAESIFEAARPQLQKAVEQPLPFALALNATDADTSEPLIISNVATGGKEDLLAHLKPGQTLRLSTAMLLSARFPVISPVGEIALDGKRVRIVDGGYFDNSGGATASRMAHEVGALRPIGIMMTNDDARARGRFCAAPKDAPSHGAGLAEILVTPVGTLDAGRANAAELHRREFRAAVEQIGGDVIEIPLFRCAEDGDPEFPLGWSLSEVVREHMDKKLTRLRGDETGPYRELVRLLH
jgi:hypothetical protein